MPDFDKTYTKLCNDFRDQSIETANDVLNRKGMPVLATESGHVFDRFFSRYLSLNDCVNGVCMAAIGCLMISIISTRVTSQAVDVLLSQQIQIESEWANMKSSSTKTMASDLSRIQVD